MATLQGLHFWHRIWSFHCSGIAILKGCTLDQPLEVEREGEGVEYLGSEDARDVALQGKPKPHTTSDKLKAQISLQQADGNLQFNSTLASVLTIPP